MADFKPHTPYNVAAHVLTPTDTYERGVLVKKYDEPTKENLFYCSFRSFGGTEKTVNNVLVLEDTAVVETWYNPLIASNCRVLVAGKLYDIIGTPENINMRNQYLVFKVKAVQGGA